jgi:hypothetical protein
MMVMTMVMAKVMIKSSSLKNKKEKQNGLKAKVK